MISIRAISAPYYRYQSRTRLRDLSAQDELVTGGAVGADASLEFSIEQGENVLKLFKGRLGLAGFFTEERQKFAKKQCLAFMLVSVLFFGGCGVYFLKSAIGAGIGAFTGFYIGVVFWLVYLKCCSQELGREVLLRIPIALEMMILLVESGLGILPALEKVVRHSKQKVRDRSLVLYALHLAYQLSARGIPFSQALEMVGNAVPHRVLRHVLLHLDLSGSEGGELIPALRSLGGHAHLEWKLAVEKRVKRLENFVIFPVFVAVMGLIALASAAPLSSVIEFTDKLNVKGEVTIPNTSR